MLLLPLISSDVSGNFFVGLLVSPGGGSFGSALWRWDALAGGLTVLLCVTGLVGFKPEWLLSSWFAVDAPVFGSLTGETPLLVFVTGLVGFEPEWFLSTWFVVDSTVLDSLFGRTPLLLLVTWLPTWLDLDSGWSTLSLSIFVSINFTFPGIFSRSEPSLLVSALKLTGFPAPEILSVTSLSPPRAPSGELLSCVKLSVLVLVLVFSSISKLGRMLCGCTCSSSIVGAECLLSALACSVLISTCEVGFALLASSVPPWCSFDWRNPTGVVFPWLSTGSSAPSNVTFPAIFPAVAASVLSSGACVTFFWCAGVACNATLLADISSLLNPLISGWRPSSFSKRTCLSLSSALLLLRSKSLNRTCLLISDTRSEFLSRLSVSAPLLLYLSLSSSMPP